MDYSFEHSDRSKRRREKREEAMRDAIALLTLLQVRFSQPFGPERRGSIEKTMNLHRNSRD
jgi:hypothetical protein